MSLPCRPVVDSPGCLSRLADQNTYTFPEEQSWHNANLWLLWALNDIWHSFERMIYKDIVVCYLTVGSSGPSALQMINNIIYGLPMPLKHYSSLFETRGEQLLGTSSCTGINITIVHFKWFKDVLRMPTPPLQRLLFRALFSTRQQ